MARTGFYKIKQYLDSIDNGGGRASRWEFVKVAGNEANLQRWEPKLCRKWGLVEKHEDDSEDERSRVYYTKTLDGQKLHDLLSKRGEMNPLFAELSRQRLHPSNWDATDGNPPFE